MVSRVPATLATCPCHSPETPSGPCSPLSVPVQVPPPCGEGWLHACISSGSEDTYWAAPGPLAPQSSPLCPLPPPQSQVQPQGSHLLGVLQGPLSASALKRGPIICQSPPCPWDALKGPPSESDTASLFISNPFFPAWKLLSSLPGQENPHSGRTTSRSFQTHIRMAVLQFKSQTLY